MSEHLSFAPWNVEHVKGDDERVADCVEFLRESDPDVSALYELEGEDVFFELVDRMPDHHFFITEYEGERGGSSGRGMGCRRS